MSDSVGQSYIHIPISSVDRVGEPHRIQDVHDQDRQNQRQRKNLKRNPFPEEGIPESDKPLVEETGSVEKPSQKQDTTAQEGPGLVIDITV